MKWIRHKTFLASILGLILACGVGYFLLNYNFGLGLVRLSYDLLPIWRGDIQTKSCVLVYLDEKTYLELDHRQNITFDRYFHTLLLDRLTQAGARAVVMDIVFSDPDPLDEAKDKALAAAIRRNGNVILAADLVPVNELENQIVPPIDLFMDEVAGLGLADMVPDKDLVVRRQPPPMAEIIPSLGWATAAVLDAEATRDEEQVNRNRWINYYSRPNVIPWVSYIDALDTNRVGDDFFHDKVVFVGARILTKNAWGRKDEFLSPYTKYMPEHLVAQRGLFVPGVYLQATSFLNYYRGDWLKRWTAGTESAIVLIIGCFFGAGLVWLRPLVATISAILSMLAMVALFYGLYQKNYLWFPWAVVLVQISLALAWAIVFNSIQLYVQKRMYEYTLGLYLSPKLVKKFSSDASMLKPGAEEQTLTILFSDIADFTDLSQAITSDELAKLMNEYFQVAVSECIHKTDGTVVKYIGDAVFAFWNAPEPQEDHARRACQAALMFRDKSKLNIKGKPLVTRIGLHTGSAKVGNFGSMDRVDYTALGESINLASRLEGLNKYLGTSCLISGDTKEDLGEALLTRYLGDFQLKGFSTNVEVHELIGDKEEEESTREWRETFSQALNNYKEGHLEFAAMGFQQTLNEKPDDGPSKFYLTRIEDLQSKGIPEDWGGQTQLFEK